MNQRIEYLESLVDEEKRKVLEEKHVDNFNKYTNYLGNGVYAWRGIYATDTRELFLMGIYDREKIEYLHV